MALLGGLLGHLEAILSRIGTLLGHLGTSLRVWTAPWAIQVACSFLLGPLLGHSWAVLGDSRAVPGAFLGRLGDFLGASWAVLERSRRSLEPSWPVGRLEKQER